MNKDVKEKWVKALRSGEYKQCQLTLSSVDDKEHCCLGILCKVLGETDEKIRANRYNVPKHLDVGLNIKEMQYLAGLNDEGFSFTSIADEIDKHY